MHVDAAPRGRIVVCLCLGGMAAAARSPPAGALCCDWLLFPAATRQLATAGSRSTDTTRPLLGLDTTAVHAKNGNLCAPLLYSLRYL